MLQNSIYGSSHVPVGGRICVLLLSEGGQRGNLNASVECEDLPTLNCVIRINDTSIISQLRLVDIEHASVR